MTAPVPGPAGSSAPVTAAVERAVAQLEELDGRPVSEHVAVLDEVHRALQDALATLDGG